MQFVVFDLVVCGDIERGAVGVIVVVYFVLGSGFRVVRGGGWRGFQVCCLLEGGVAFKFL